MAIAWGCVLGLWVLVSCFWWRYSNGLHVVLTLTATVTLIYLGLAYNYYKALSSSGMFVCLCCDSCCADEGTAGLPDSTKLNSQTIFSEIQDSLYIMTFLMLSSAWCIVDRVFRREFICM